MSAPARQFTPDELATLADELAERLAPQMVEKLAELLADQDGPTPQLVDAAWLARRYDRSADYFRRDQRRFGATRVGDGPKPRLMFDPVYVEQVLRGDKPPPQPARRVPRKRQRASSNGLLPIRGREGA
ncbi:MAG: hypothetical protein ACRDMH_03240 [Solirubrobacterales bacterium]